MSIRIDRRQLLHAAMYGLGAVALPGVAQVLQARGFTHGVASGEPTADSVLLWTRFVTDRDTRLSVEVARDVMFGRIVARGECTAEPDRDHTARTVVGGLEPGRWYFYRFIASDGSMSAVGRTRTLPQGDVQRFGLGLFSCSNIGFGWFNAYAHACERTDLDLVVHVGDYLYEYAIGTYPTLKELMPGRLIQPSNEILSLADYRLRHACYRLDPDLQRLHQFYPMIAQWDDHEFANDAWTGGAENHQSATEGDWAVRKAVAERVYNEWMPVSGERWREYQIGSLATLFKAETRITGRSELLDLNVTLKGTRNLTQALVDFRDGPLSSATRTLLGLEQEKWLRAGLQRSTSAKTRWQVLAQQVVMGEMIVPQEAKNWIGDDATETARKELTIALAAARAGLPFNFDCWDGFPAARRRLLEDAANANANLVVLAGDSHNAWANNLENGKTAVGVEFATHSVTSPGFESYLPRVSPDELAAALRATNRHLAYADTRHRGYTSVMLTPQSATGNFHFLKTIRERDTALLETRSLSANFGSRRFT
jgi:alkaline phosphatase D